MKKFWFMTMVLALVVTGSVAAADSTEADNQATTTESTPSATVSSTTMAPAGSAGGGSTSDWRFAITPIAVWGFNIGGNVTLAGHTRNVNASFSDVTDDLDSAGGLGVEIGKGNWGFYLNASVLGWDEDFDNWVAPNGSSGDLEFTLDYTSIDGGFMYRLPLSTTPKTPRVDLTIGAKYTELEIGAKGTSGFSFDRDEDINFTDPMVGLRVIQPIGKGFNALVKSQVGGFGFSDNQSQLNWDFQGGIGYHFQFDGWGIAVAGGYKISHFDYSLHDDPSRLYIDLRFQGPFIAMTVTF